MYWGIWLIGLVHWLWGLQFAGSPTGYSSAITEAAIYYVYYHLLFYWQNKYNWTSIQSNRFMYIKTV